MQRLGVSFEFSKAAPDGRYVRGWASVVTVNGRPVEDDQGDVISMHELRKSAHEFVLNQRVAKAMHGGGQVGDVVESVLVDDDMAQALGIADSRRGWWVGMAINDEAIAGRVASGDFKAFSIGGRGTRKHTENS
jgi:hypothetical protein